MVSYKGGEVSVIKMSSYHKHYQPEEHSGVCVVRRKGEGDEEFVKRFRKKFSKSGIAKEVRERMFYEKPSQKRRRKKAQSIRLLKREAEKAEQMRERYQKMKAKQKKQRDRANKLRGEKHDKRSGRQDRSRVPAKDVNVRRAVNS